MKKHILVTGGTGSVGSNLLKYLSRKTDARLFSLSRNLPAAADEVERVTYLKGDVAKEGLGLSHPVYSDLTSSLTDIVHAAAITEFDWELSDISEINVGGTAEIIKLAKKAANLQRIVHLSTVYVSGDTEGVILEEHFDCPNRFINSYEESKFNSELLFRDSNLPYEIYRLSTILGRSDNGVVERFTAPHHAMRVMYLGLASMLPGNSTYPVDLISSNGSTEIISKLFNGPLQQGKIFHIAATPAHSFTLDEIVKEAFDHFSKIDPVWQKNKYQKPLIVTQEIFDEFLESASVIQNPILHQVLGSLKFFSHQLSYSKDFSIANTQSAVPNYFDHMAPAGDYLGKVLNYCLSSKWGKIKKN